MDATGESNPVERVATALLSVCSVAMYSRPDCSAARRYRGGKMECSEGLAPSDAGFTTQGLGAFGIEHGRAGALPTELQPRRAAGIEPATSRSLSCKLVRTAGIAPARCLPSEGSDELPRPRPDGPAGRIRTYDPPLPKQVL